MASDWNGMTWLNPPARTETRPDGLLVVTGKETDFWQTTYYGFRHDNGHFLSRPRTGEFTMATRFAGRYQTLYDQAGLMVRHDAQNWLKCGIEFTDGLCHMSTVATVDGRSDWSAFALADLSDALDLRLTRLGDALFVQYRTAPELAWRMARLAYFPAGFETLDVGIMACSPQRTGFEVVFQKFSIGDPASRDIH
ncbi:MAG: DUF1349 domain-containing protein [Allorhizobium sp.]